MRRRDIILTGLGAVVLVIGLACLDEVVDGGPFSAADFVFEILDRTVTVGAMVGVAWVTFALRDVRRSQATLRHDLARAIAQGSEWRSNHETTLDDLAGAIRRQFAAWALSPAEADIAGLMLKGVSLRDIAGLRQTSDATIRQQAQAIYRKSGLSGRTELAAYFLESLFEEQRGGPKQLRSE